MKLEKILIATDFSPAAELAGRRAAAFAQRYGEAEASAPSMNPHLAHTRTRNIQALDSLKTSAANPGPPER